MKLAFIAPTSLLRQHQSIAASRFQMVIASQMLVEATREHTPYIDFYKERAQNGDFIILDNGVWETGKSVTDNDLLSAADHLGASEVVIPDVMRDAESTLTLASGFINTYRRRYHSLSHEGRRPRLMFVPQGANFHEWLDCYYRGINKFGQYIDTIGIPKWLGCMTPDNYQGRGLLLSAPAMQFFARFDYHLLGVNTLSELEYLRLYDQRLLAHIRSADTSLPFVMAQEDNAHGAFRIQNSLRSAVVELQTKRIDNYFDADLHRFSFSAVQDNIEALSVITHAPISYKF